MPQVELTKRNIDTLKPCAERYTAWDTEVSGFGLRITPSGQRVYILKYRTSGQQKWFTIGRHGSPWTPREARLEARRLLGEIARGGDPAGARGANRKAMIFSDLCDLYLAEGTEHKKPSTLRSDRGRITLHLKPLLGSKRANGITKADVARLQIDVRAGKTAAKATAKRQAGSNAAGGVGVAAQCVTLVSTILQFAVDRGIRTDNPARGIKKPPVRKMQRFLSEVELTRLGKALNAERDQVHAVAAIKLLALTGCRLGEILALHWRDADLERRILSFRDSKTREKFVYLSPPAVAILAQLPRFVGNPFVVVGKRSSGALGGLDKIWGRIRKHANLEDVRLHDLRHTFASIGAASGLGLPIVGRLLGHTQATTTLRYSHLGDDPLRRGADMIGAAVAASLRTEPAPEIVPLMRDG